MKTGVRVSGSSAHVLQNVILISKKLSIFSINLEACMSVHSQFQAFLHENGKKCNHLHTKEHPAPELSF